MAQAKKKTKRAKPRKSATHAKTAAKTRGKRTKAVARAKSVKRAGAKAASKKPARKSAKRPAKQATRKAPARAPAGSAASLVAQATEAIWLATKRREFYPKAWVGKLTVEQAYRVQLGLLKRHVAAGDRHVGWKVGLTAKAIQQQLNFHEPVMGFLLASGSLPSNCVVPFNMLIAPGIENELCLSIGRTLRGPGVTPEQARAAIVGAAPAFELIEARGSFAAHPPLAITDNVQQKAFITGPERTLTPDQRLGATSVEVLVDGQVVNRAMGTEVMGDPSASVAWLANKLAEFGMVLEAGMRVMSGSFTVQVILKPGQRVESRFDPIGTVTARFP